MCRQLILLAKNDFRQMIFTCEHGTMHITHQHTTLCLNRAGFLQLARWVTEGNLFALNQSEAWRVRETDDGQVELWLGSGGLRMTVIEFFAFTDLLREAMPRLETFKFDTLPLDNHWFEARRAAAKPSLN